MRKGARKGICLYSTASLPARFSGVYIPVWQEVCINKAFFLSFIRAIALAPASGYRESATGVMAYVGTYGFSWSSSPLEAGGIGAVALRFLAIEMTPLFSAGRGSSRPVRCVQHLRAALLGAY